MMTMVMTTMVSDSIHIFAVSTGVAMVLGATSISFRHALGLRRTVKEAVSSDNPLGPVWFVIRAVCTPVLIAAIAVLSFPTIMMMALLDEALDPRLGLYERVGHAAVALALITSVVTLAYVTM